MELMSNAISVKSLKKTYKNVSVLKDVNFEVEKGTIFSLLGSNGAGKTTTIKILTTLLKPDTGSIIINNYDAVKCPDKVHEDISLTGQFAAVDEALTGLENLIMIGKLNHLAAPKERAAQLLTYFDLEKAGNRYASTYSGGMRRKLDIAMSLVSNPSIIFLDEPTTGLDPQSRHAMWKIIQSLKDTGVTIFLTTQYLEEAEQLADKIAILNKGSIIVEGSPNELKKLLPQGIIEFEFASKQNMDEAYILLKGYKVIPNTDEISLSVCTDGSIKQLTELFSIFDTEKINIKEFTQKLPTLEDVFLTLIGEREEQ